MPAGRMYLPYPKKRRGRHRRSRRSSAQRTIAQAWRARNRKKTSLLARTAKANRTAVKTLARSVETKMIELSMAQPTSNYQGQFCVRIPVDINGKDGTGFDFVVKPFGLLGRGDNSNQRTGDWVKVKSLTYKIMAEAPSGVAPDTHNRVGCIIALDRHPEDTNQNLMDAVGPTSNGTLLGGNSQYAILRYQNMTTCGNTQRYKVLKHLKGHVQSPLGTTSVPVYPPSLVWSGTLTLPYRLRYDNSVGPTGPIPDNQQLCFFFYSDSAAAPHPTINMHSRFRFKDA